MSNFEINKKQFYKYLLKEFYTEKINEDIWKLMKMKKYSIKSNLIINTHPNFNVIKSIVSSLIIQNAQNIEYISTPLYGLIQSMYKSENEGAESLNSLIEHKDYFVLYEFGDPNNKLYGEVLTYILNNRILNNKFNLLIFTTRKPEVILDKSILNNFKIINLRDNKYNTVSVDKSGDVY